MENNIEQNQQFVRDFYVAVNNEDYDTASNYLHNDFNFYHQVDNFISNN